MQQKRLKRTGRYGGSTALGRYLGKSRWTIGRWVNDPKLGAPQPAIINDVPLHDFDAWDEWLKARVRADESNEADAA